MSCGGEKSPPFLYGDIMDEPQPLLDCAALGVLMGLSANTVKINASRAPDRLPPRAPGRLLRWHPDSYREWAMGAKKVVRRGRPRELT